MQTTKLLRFISDRIDHKAIHSNIYFNFINDAEESVFRIFMFFVSCSLIFVKLFLNIKIVL